MNSRCQVDLIDTQSEPDTLPIHYELSRPFDQVHNSSAAEEQNCGGSGLSANGYLQYFRRPVHTAERQWPRICEQNNKKKTCLVSGQE